jgi:bacterioferritin-associated ferredoxin
MGTAPNRRPRVGLPIAVGGAGGVFRTRGAGQVATVGVATMYLCVCTGVTESDVRRVARDSYPTPEGLIRDLGLDGDACCGRCALEIDRFLAVALEEHGRATSASTAAGASLSPAAGVPAARTADWWPAL